MNRQMIPAVGLGLVAGAAMATGAGRMLIDEVNDPHELVNLADQPELASLVEKFHQMAEEYVKGQREL